MKIDMVSIFLMGDYQLLRHRTDDQFQVSVMAGGTRHTIGRRREAESKLKYAHTKMDD